jgi:sugar phosphate isomerase/epimerase
MSQPLAVQLWTVREQIAADRDATLRRVADIGFTGVEPFQPTEDPVGFRKVADDLGLTVVSAHAHALLTAEPAEVFDALATLGTDLAIVPAGIAEPEFTTREGLARTADILNALAEQGAAHGIKVGYHNHWWEFEPEVDGRHALEVLADLVAPEVFFEIDTYWAAVAGADVVGVLARLGDQVRALHVKDGPIVKGAPHTAVGQGLMPVADILAAAPPTALRIVELDACDGDVFQALADSHAFLSTLEQS